MKAQRGESIIEENLIQSETLKRKDISLLFLVIKMSGQGDTISMEEINQFFILKAMQQQFERVNLVLGEIKDRIDNQNTVIVNL